MKKTEEADRVHDETMENLVTLREATSNTLSWSYPPKLKSLTHDQCVDMVAVTNKKLAGRLSSAAYSEKEKLGNWVFYSFLIGLTVGGCLSRFFA